MQKWETILKNIDKDEVPVELLEALTVNLVDGTKVNIDIKGLLDDGTKPSELEEHINGKLAALDSVIEDIDFFICIDTVAATVQPVTDKILKNL